MFRELKWVRGLRVDVSEELRGWRWDSPPVAPPPVGFRISLSELGGGLCETRRDVYLKRVAGVKARPSAALNFGSYIHGVFVKTLRRLRRLVEEGVASGWELLSAFDPEAVAREAAAGGEVDERGVKLARWLAVQVAARLDEVASRAVYVDSYSLAARAVPLLEEYVVDGRPLGLTMVKADAFLYDVVVEVKVGPEHSRHKLALAGYAMALEADEEVPVDRGLLVYVHVNSRVRVTATPVAIGDSLRWAFLEERDALLELLDSGRDPGLASACLESCPFFEVCHGANS